jgi:hypothetical protein
MNYRKMERTMATSHQTLIKFGMMANLRDPMENKLIHNLMMASDQYPKYFKDRKQNSSVEKSKFT